MSGMTAVIQRHGNGNLIEICFLPKQRCPCYRVVFVRSPFTVIVNVVIDSGCTFARFGAGWPGFSSGTPERFSERAHVPVYL